MSKIAVEVKNEEQWSKVVCYSRKLDAPDYNYPEDEYSDLCVDLNNGCYCSAEWYQRNNYTIISYSEFESKYLNKITEFEPGKYYYVTYKSNNKSFINKYETTSKIEYFIEPRSDHYSTNGISGYVSDMRECRFATQEEIDWLEACHKAKKFIPKEEALKKPEGFKKGDYIVVLRDKSEDSDYIKNNHCYIHNGENIGFFYTNKDCKGTPVNTTDISYSDSSTWRYATKEEIDEYNRIGKPYDVSTLIKKESHSSDELASLPELWYIPINSDTIETINKVRALQKKNKNPLKLGEWDYYGVNTLLQRDDLCGLGNINGYTEISLDQLKKWVLKENPTMKNIPDEDIYVHDFELGEQVLYNDQVVTILGFTKNLNSCVVGNFKNGHSGEFKEYFHDKQGNPIEFSPGKDRFYVEVSKLSKLSMKEEPKMDTKQTLLEEAKRRYPVGTTYRSRDGSVYTIEEDDLFQNYWTHKDSVGISNKGWVKYQGIWSKILEEYTPKSSEISNFKVFEYPSTERYRAGCDPYEVELETKLINVKPKTIINNEVKKVKSVELNLVKQKKLVLF
jgi:hypothetical protein